MKNIYCSFVIFFIFMVVFISCSKKKENKKTKEVQKENVSNIVIKKFSFTNSEKGKIKWILYSNEAVINKSTNIADLKDVKILYKNYYTILSNSAKYYMNEKKAYLKGDVEIIDNKSYIFKTQMLNFDSKANKVSTNSKIKFTGKGVYLTALSLTGFLDKHKFILKGKVYSEIR